MTYLHSIVKRNIKINIIMENEEKMMTGEESLRIITEMINKTKVNISQGSFHLLFWGWLIIICSLSEWLLTKLHRLSSSLLCLVSGDPWSICIYDLWICNRTKSKSSHLCRYCLYVDMDRISYLQR